MRMFHGILNYKSKVRIWNIRVMLMECQKSYHIQLSHYFELVIVILFPYSNSSAIPKSFVIWFSAGRMEISFETGCYNANNGISVKMEFKDVILAYCK